MSSTSEGTQHSIFNDFSSRDLREPSHFGTFSQPCSTFSGWLCQDGNCLFALATGSGVILLIKLPPRGGESKGGFLCNLLEHDPHKFDHFYHQWHISCIILPEIFIPCCKCCLFGRTLQQCMFTTECKKPGRN